MVPNGGSRSVRVTDPTSSRDGRSHVNDYQSSKQPTKENQTRMYIPTHIYMSLLQQRNVG